MVTERRPAPGGRTTVRCRRCGQRNLGIDIWCSRCGSNLDWVGEKQSEPAGVPSRRLRSRRSPERAAPGGIPGKEALAALATAGRGALDRGRRTLQAERERRSAAAAAAAQEREQRRQQQATLEQQRRAQAVFPQRAPAAPRESAPPRFRASLPSRSWPSIRRGWGLLAIPGTARALIAIAGVLVVAILAIVFTLPGGRPTLPTASTSSTSPSRGQIAVSMPNSAIPAAIAPAEARSGLAFAGTGSCPSSKGCLRVTQQFDGLNAAVVLFSAGSARTCATYLYRDAGGWHPLTASCALTGHLDPLAGQQDTVRIRTGCANARDSASLSGGVVACLASNTSVFIDAGPNYASGKLWWHLQKVGWMVQDFLSS